MKQNSFLAYSFIKNKILKQYGIMKVTTEKLPRNYP